MSDRLRALYVCYLPISDPLVETQVVAYLEGLAAAGHRIHLLTFETRRRSRSERCELRARLAARGIGWHALRYHKRPSLPATLADAVLGALYAAWLLRRHRLEAIHARVHVPAAISLLAGVLSPHLLLFDVRGLMAEEYVDAGRWKQGGLSWRITKWVERRALRRAAACVVLTPQARGMLPEIAAGPPTTVIPCCADLDRFRVDAKARERARKRFRLADGDPVMVYIGKFGGWYLQEQMVSFYGAARQRLPGLRFLVLTQDDPALIEAELGRRGVEAADYRIDRVPPEEMGAALAAADFAISFVAPLPSKRASSPTKLGEYLAAGLPVVATAGVGAMDEPIRRARAGVLVDDSRRDYAAAAEQLAGLLADPATPERCRALAAAELSLAEVGIPRYRAVYRALAERSRERAADPLEP
jgi:glycosyltransferase involved in cell wall biosynthesis